MSATITKSRWRTVKAEVLVDRDGWIRAVCIRDPIGSRQKTMIGMMGTVQELTETNSIDGVSSINKAKRKAAAELRRAGYEL